MSAERDLAKAIADAVDAKVESMRQGSSTMPATYQGTDSEGKGWVLLPGATEPTPVSRMAVEAAQGDTVSVTVANGKATVDSNVSNPSAGLAGVKVVERTANTASATASNALAAASDARTAATSAQASADTARQAANEATADASTARAMAESASADAATASASAAIAKESADKATFALSDVENVVGTLNWIAEHGEYVLTEDTAIVEGKAYYTRSGTDPDYVYTVVASPVVSELSTYYELSLDESVQNYLASHLWLDDYGLNLSVDSANGYRIHQGTVDGTHSAGAYIIDPQGAIVASFGAGGFQVGLDDESHLVGDYHSLQLIDKEGDTYFHVSDLRDASGVATMVDTFIGDGSTLTFYLSLMASSTDYTVIVDGVEVASDVVKIESSITFSTAPAAQSEIIATYTSASNLAKAYTLGTRVSGSNIGARSVAEGSGTIASGSTSHAEGGGTTASGYRSHAEGSKTTASGQYSHAEGGVTTASGDYSHAEGGWTTAARYAHAEGYNTAARGDYSHAEGSKTTASGQYSHSEGYITTASGQYSHAQNLGTKARSESQTALGKYNAEDANGDYAVIVGNGTSDTARSNALTVGWDGGVEAAGEVTATDSDGNLHNLTGKVAKSGGTMTGSLSFINNEINRDAAAPSAKQYGQKMAVWKDADGESIGYIQAVRNTDGRIGLQITPVHEKSDGSNAYGALTVYVDNTGVTTYGVNNPANFRSAIGLSDTPSSTSTVSNICTAGSNVTITSANFANWGKVATLNIAFKRTATTTGTFNIGTIVSGKRPAITTYGGATSTAITWVSVQSGGTVQAYASAATSASSTYYCSFTYVLA